MAHSTAEQIADALGVDRRRVFEYVRAGMPKIAPGRFDENACLRWMVRHQAELIKRRESETSSKSADVVRRARAKLLEVRTEDAEIDLRRRRGELIPLSVFEETMTDMLLTARQQPLQLPGRVAPELEGLDRAAIKQRLTLAVHAALTALAERGNDTPMPEGQPAADPAPAANGDGAPPTNGKG